MPSKQEFEAKFWKSIRSDMTVMLSVAGIDPRPMTAHFDGLKKTIFFFTAKDTEIAQKAARSKKATLVYSAKDHDLFATVHGTMKIDADRETVDRLWNRYVAAWFEKGKDDPKLCLLRFEPADAQVWLDASSVVAGVKMFLGLGDPKRDYENSVAKVTIK